MDCFCINNWGHASFHILCLKGSSFLPEEKNPIFQNVTGENNSLKSLSVLYNKQMWTCKKLGQLKEYFSTFH